MPKVVKRLLIFWLTCLVATIIVIFFLGFLTSRALAQSGERNDGHRENHDWYQDLRQPGTGYSCCNGLSNGVEGDCRPVQAKVGDDGMWRAFLNGEWVIIPPSVVVPMEKNKNPLHAHICAGKSGMIYCFVPTGPGG